MTARSAQSRRTPVLTLLVLGGLSLLSATPTWLTTSSATALSQSVDVTVTGTAAAPGVSAAALVVMAAGLALGLVGRVARWVSLAVVALGGLVVAGSALSLVLSPDAAARSGVADVTGVTGAVGDIDVSVVPFLTVVLGAAIVAAAVWTALAPISWAQRSTRYETPATGGHAPAARREPAADGTLDDRDAWDSLTQGDDPT